MICSESEPTELALTLVLDGASDCALLRVVATLHRRRCRVTAAGFWSERGELELRLLAAPVQARQIERWLEALVEVRQVRRTSEPACIAPTAVSRRRAPTLESVR
jgi:hypothetical protein